MRKKWIAVLVVAIVSAVAYALVPSPSRQCWRISEINFESIRFGMTFQEVEAIFGPPGDYRSGATIDADLWADCNFGQPMSAGDSVGNPTSRFQPGFEIWRADYGTAIVWFRENRASGATFIR